MNSLKNVPIIDPLVCPLCGASNSCANLGTKDINKTCWCNDPNIRFPQDLIDKIPQEKRRKACICRACALKHQSES